MSLIRRVVTTMDAQGRSSVLEDGPPAAAVIVVSDSDAEGDGSVQQGERVHEGMPRVRAPEVTLLWDAHVPFDYDDMGGDPGDKLHLFPIPGCALFMRLVIPGNTVAEKGDALDVAMHASNSLDFIYIARGQVDLVLSSGRVLLQTDDHLVMQGDFHGFDNPYPDECVMIVAVNGAPER